MNNLARLTKIKKRIFTLQSEVDKARGAIEGIENQLKEEFDCDSIEEAGKLLEKAEAEEKKTKIVFEKALTEFEDEFSEAFDE